MAWFNNIHYSGTCPECGACSRMQSQTYMAADWDYADRDYELGERMAWFAPNTEDYLDWMAFGPPPSGPVY